MRPLSFQYQRHGLQAVLATPAGELAITSHLVGPYNLANIMAATATALGLGVAPGAVQTALAGLAGVPGRLQRLGPAAGPSIFVDYAHTPDALDQVLAALNSLDFGRIITVFGCGGDRDKTKRPLMGQAAGRGSGLTVVTSDNPRTEDPLAIIEDIEAGLQNMGCPLLSPARQAGGAGVSSDAGSKGRHPPGRGTGPQDRCRAGGRQGPRGLPDLGRRAHPFRRHRGGRPGLKGVPRLMPAAFTAADLVAACRGVLLQGRLEDAFVGVSTDSRSCQSSELFVPLVGERHDGHTYIAEALGRGVRGVVVAAEARRHNGLIPPLPRGTTAVAVADTLQALGDLARAWRRRFPIPVVSLTGSCGKTTAKEMIALILARYYRVLKNDLNLNNLIGLPRPSSSWTAPSRPRWWRWA